MESLEKTLQEIRTLTSNLCAEIIVKEKVEESGYWTEVGRNHSQVQGQDDWVIPREAEPEVKEPDYQVREDAKTKLQQFYESSESQVVRFVAGRAISTDSKELDELLQAGVKDLRRRLHSTKDTGRTKRVKVGEHLEDIEYKIPSCDRHAGPAMDSVRVDDYEEHSIYVPDSQKRLNAFNEAVMLYDLVRYPEIKDVIKEAYHGDQPPEISSWAGEVLVKDTEDKDELKGFYKNSDFSNIRSLAGRALGYSNPRILAHENPIPVILGALGGFGLVSGLGYMLSQ